MYPSHHALLFIGYDSFDSAQFGIEHQATHDIIVQKYTEFRINDARNLITLATQTPAHHHQQYFVVQAESIAVEAQNALLKLLEEPPTVSSFVFVLPQNTLLPTLRSRFMMVDVLVLKKDIEQAFVEFVSQPVPTRLELISSLATEKNADAFATLRAGLMQYLDKIRLTLNTAQVVRLNWALHKMQQRGSSQKMLWEEVAFTLPVEVLSAT